MGEGHRPPRSRVVVKQRKYSRFSLIFIVTSNSQSRRGSGHERNLFARGKSSSEKGSILSSRCYPTRVVLLLFYPRYGKIILSIPRNFYRDRLTICTRTIGSHCTGISPILRISEKNFLTETFSWLEIKKKKNKVPCKICEISR